MPQEPIRGGEELLITADEVGQRGGRLVVALRSEPRTLNPVLAADGSSKEVLGRIMGDLVHINRFTQKTEAALAKSWKRSPDGRRFTLELRRGIRFSDGQPFEADDVLFTFQVYLDEKVRSPQRDLLIVGGKPIVVSKRGTHTVVLEIAQPYAPAERIFDSIAILPRHLLKKAYDEGALAQAWGLNTPAGQIAGLGPFRLKGYVAGQRLVLERNPYFWKADRKKNRLPYLDEIAFLFVPSEDAQVVRFQAGETHIVNRISAKNFAVLQRDQQARGYQMLDLGPGLEYNFLVFNLNDLSAKNLPAIARKQAWFRDARFRRALSLALDRAGIIRLVYDGRGTPLWSHVTAGNRLWVDAGLARPGPSLEQARQLLRAAGFSWKGDGTLQDVSGAAVEFSVLVSSTNAQRQQMATILQSDLQGLGIRVQVAPLEFRTVLDRIFNTLEYEASVSGLASGDADPTSEMNVWLSSGATHLWNPAQKKPATPWEAEMDSLMQQQNSTLDYKKRKKLYDRVQRIVAEQLPIICLASPHVLVGVKNGIGNFQPAILDPQTLWNAEALYFRAGAAGRP